MNTCNRILLVGILTFLILVEVCARAIPDFDTDEDLNAWHKFGLRSFYGPWSVIARKPNGDFVSYADYGARVPSDFRPISDEAIDNDEEDSSGGIWQRQYPSKYTTGLSDFAAGYELAPQDLSVFSNGVKNPDETLENSHISQYELTDNAITLRSASDLDKLLKTVKVESTNTESKRDILELIGIVGLISDEGNSSEENSSTENEISIENSDDQTTGIDPSINVTS